MSIKFYDETKKQWIKIASLLANSIKVLDVEGNYESKSVEGCLEEIADAMETKFDDVQLTSSGALNFYSNGVIVKTVYISASKGGDISNEIIALMQKQLDDHETRIQFLEENGGNGNGGQDGNTAPTITTTFDQSSFSTDDEIEIPYFVMDSQGGNFIANYTINADTSTETVKVGPNTWKVGKLSKGKHTLKLYLKDYALFSNELVFNITVGSLEISSSFRDKDYGLNENVVVNYDIETIGDIANLQTERILDGKVTNVPSTSGRNSWTLGVMNKGVHKISLKAFTDEASSNILSYTFTVTDSDSLYVSSTFDEEQDWNVEDRLIIPYRISLQGGSKFKAKYTVNGIAQPLADANLGMNFWDLGYVNVGDYELTIQATNVAGSMESNVMTLRVSVRATDFTPIQSVEDYLLCWFDAQGKSNAYEDREEWIDKSGNNITAKLVDVNYANNGWIDDGLRLNGDAYCEIDLQPFTSGVSEYGTTVDVQYKFNNSGNDDARVFSCELPIMPGTGVSIDSININLLGKESINQSPNNENSLIRATFVIDPASQRSYIYVNGVICNTALLSKSEEYVHDSKIYLNAMRDIDGNITNLSDCTIYNVRVYDKALSHEEVVQNHISDMRIEEQKKAVRRNTFSSLGQMDMDGNFSGMGADDQVPLRVAFSPNDGPGVKFDYPEVLVDWQGNSSLEYAIKNYNIDLIDEEGNGVDIQLKEDWPDHDSYHIKANMVDSSHSFNLGIAKLLPKIYTEPHPGIVGSPEKPVKYAVDGFPITCFHNGRFHGLYTFNLKQHRKVFGMDKNSTTQFMYRAEENSAMGAAAWRDSSDHSIEQEWEERHPKRPPGTGVQHNEFRRLINFVKDSSDAVFVRDLTKHFNKNYLLDYYLICYAFGGIDSLGKNMTMASWDATANSGIWYPMFYDMDTFFGFDNKGELVWGPDVRCPEDYNTSGSLLWERVEKLLQADIRARYAQIRRGGLNLDTVLDTLCGEIIDPIGETFYNMDALDKYLSQGAAYLYMAKGNRVQHLKRWLTARFLYVDSMFGYLPDTENTIIIRNTMPGLFKIRIKTYTPQQIKVEFGGTGVGGQEPNAGTLTKMCNNKEWTEFSYFFDGVYQKDISITGAKYIMGLEGLENTEMLMLDVRYCEKLIELDAHGNPNLTSLNLANCTRLQKLDVHDCTRLGSTTGTPLDVGNCYNLKYLDISNTQVPALTTTNCSYLTFVNISNSYISAIKYSHLQSLKNLVVENCSRLTKVEIDSCQGITELTIKNNPELRDVIIDGCKNITSLTVQNLRSLNNLIINDCPNLATVKIATCISLRNLDLTGAEGLVSLSAPSSVIETINFGEISTLKSLDINKNFRIRELDFGRCKSQIEALNIKECENIRRILSINVLLTTYDQVQMFRGNDYIQTITGTIKFSDEVTSAREMFRNCIDLEEVPEIILNQVTVLSGMFQNCVNLTTVPDWDTTLITDMSYMFSGCAKLENAPNFNTSKVEYFNNMFTDCISLEIAPTYNVKKSTSLQAMFRGCTSLYDVREFDTSTITNMSELFAECSSLQYVPTFDTRNVTNMTAIFDGCIELRTIPNFRTDKIENFSRAFGRCEYISVIPNLITANAKNMSYMFYGCTGLNYIQDMDMSSATNIAGMFENCYNLYEVPAFNTSNVENFNSLFRSCSSLTEIPELDTTKAKDIACMFWDCRNVEYLPDLNTTNVTQMYETFFGCTSLKQIPNLITDDEEMESPTSKVKNMRGLFSGCNNLTSVPEFGTESVTDIAEIFSGCNKLTRVPNIDMTNVIASYDMFNGCSALVETPVLFTTDGSKVGSKITNMYQMFRGCSKLTEVPDIDTSKSDNLMSFYEGCSSITSVPKLNTAKVKFAYGMFRSCSSLTTIPDLDFSSLEEAPDGLFEGCKSLVVAPKVIISDAIDSLSYMFKNCSELTTIPEIDLKNVTNITEMFRGCTSLSDIPVFTNGTSGVTNMSGLFNGCAAMTDVPSSLNTSNVTDMSSMFANCPGLVEITQLDSRRVTNMDSLFSNCANLITVPELETSKVKSMSNMFSGCSSIVSVPMMDTSAVTSMGNMFRDCTSLVNVPNYDTSQCTYLSEMFRGCSKLRVAPEIDTSKSESVYCMFYNCSSLEEAPTYDLEKASNVDRMFNNAEKLRKASFRNNRINFTMSGFNSLEELFFYDTARGVSLTINSNMALTGEALNNLFESLAEVERATINISGNLGTYECDPTIAEGKGWTVVIDYSFPHPMKRYLS